MSVFKLKDENSTKIKNVNPIDITHDKEKNMIFFRGIYAINKLDNIIAMILSGRISPSEYKSRYAPRTFTYKKYVYDLLSMIDRTRCMDLVYIQIDAKKTLRDFDEIVQNYISTANDRNVFRSRGDD